MPCDTIRQTTVDLGKVDQRTLFNALAAMGLAPNMQGNTIRFAGGYFANGLLQLNSSNAETTTARIKQGYSAEIVKSQAKKYGWQIKTTGTNKFEVTKRTI